MASKGHARIVIGVAASIAVAGYLAVEARAPVATASAEEPAKTPKNTGSPAGPAFLLDFTKRQDRDSHYLADYEMNEDWIKIAFRSSNISFDKEGMTLSMLRTRMGKLPVAGAEFQRNGTYGYGRYETVMKAADGYGAISSFFIYTGGHFGDPHDEIDFEFLGKSPRHVHLNYFKGGDNAPVDVPLWFDTSASEHLYAFEWAPDSIRWYVDGVKVHEVTAVAGAKIPSTSSRVMANLWAGTGTDQSWTGEPRFTQTESKYRCISHVPMSKKGVQCSDTFKPPVKPLASN